ncbi:MAG: hypothetical protein ACK4MI_15155 [Brevundimonas sp.]|uniref:hypothetical protein n=1 Tax=Brevundimonas sp. TaxID=1871086 RepID=UPI0028D2FCED|nr:hypothetical protein [uncultured Brevundimonas sp.]
MLALLMRIAVEGAAIAHPAPVVDADMARPAPVIDRAITACDPMLRQTESRHPRPGGMLDRSRDAGEARRYLLFDLRDQNNCPTPISYDVPGQGRALDRNLLAPDQRRPATPAPPAPLRR